MRRTQVPTLAASALLLLLLLAPSLAADRGDAFPGYKEEGAPAECKNQLADEYCEDYKKAAMCGTGYVKTACKKTCGACEG
ncbi:hypothetical protein ABPG75_005394 [Micractinium tetrahymenae]